MWARGPHGHLFRIRWSGRREEQNAHVGYLRKGLLNHRSNFPPVESAESAPQRGDGNGPDIQPPDIVDQCLQSRSDIADEGLGAPVTLGGKVDDVAWIEEPPIVENEHATGHHLSCLTGRLIGFEVFRKCLFELKRYAFAHEPDAVHGVHQRLGVGLQHISFCKLNHRHSLFVSNAIVP